MKLILLGIALGLAGVSPAEADKECPPHSRPWQVNLHGDGLSCSGALIDQWWLVTSFSCNVRPGSTLASLGEHDLTADEGTEQHIRVADVIVRRPHRSPMHSLTLVRLALPARFDQHVRPVPLPTRCPRPGESCRVSGWGSTVSNVYQPRAELKCIVVPVVDDHACTNNLPDNIYWSPGMVCAGRADTDNCMMDTSSVMECGGQLHGVTWFGQGCSDAARPSVYTRMCRYTAWINRVMEQYTPLGTTTTTAAAGPPGTTTPANTE